ncbi:MULTISPECIES: glycoside hydrolase family 6 protein [unclassified Modestobacter]
MSGPTRAGRLRLLVAAVVVPALAACQPLTPGTTEAPAPGAVEQQLAGGVAPELGAFEPGGVAPAAPKGSGASEPEQESAGGVALHEPADVEEPRDAAATDIQVSHVDGSGTPAAGASAAGAPVAGPLAGDTLYGPNAGAAEASARLQGSNPADAALLAEMAGVPTATWLGAWVPDVTSAVRQRVAEAQAQGAVPVFVAYNAPNLDCGGHSASNGGAQSVAGYESWIRAVAAGIGDAEAVVVVEPDTLALLCGEADERLRVVRSAVTVLEAHPRTHTYIDAGHANWIDAGTMAQRLLAAGIEDADGFALNVSNFEGTEGNVSYGSALSALAGGAHFVVDTSRNGNGPGDDWCNPTGRALGQETTTHTGNPLVDAFIWVKTPGESDGTCNGGPPAGRFWPEYALGLARG